MTINDNMRTSVEIGSPEERARLAALRAENREKAKTLPKRTNEDFWKSAAGKATAAKIEKRQQEGTLPPQIKEV